MDSHQNKKILVADPTNTLSGTEDDNRQDMIKANRIVLFPYIKLYALFFFFLFGLFALVANL